MFQCEVTPHIMLRCQDTNPTDTSKRQILLPADIPRTGP